MSPLDRHIDQPHANAYALENSWTAARSLEPSPLYMRRGHNHVDNDQFGRCCDRKMVKRSLNRWLDSAYISYITIPIKMLHRPVRYAHYLTPSRACIKCNSLVSTSIILHCRAHKPPHVTIHESCPTAAPLRVIGDLVHSREAISATGKLSKSSSHRLDR